MSEANTKNSKSYDQWSSFYDEYPNPTVAIDQITFPKLWRHVTGKNVLEIGCGTGRHTEGLLLRGNRVTGIDLSDGMLREARKKFVGHPVTFIQGDILSIPFDGMKFDVCMMSLVLEHIEDLHTFFRKVSTCLQPGGQFFMSEFHPDKTAVGASAHFTTAEGAEVVLKSFAHTESDIKSAAEKCGFKINLVKTVRGDQQLVKINDSWIKYLDKPMIQLWEMSLL